MQYALHSTLT